MAFNFHDYRNQTFTLRNNASFGGHEIENPIPGLIQDDERIRRVIKDFPILPYWGTKAHSNNRILWLFDQLSLYSPSVNACTNQIINAAFGGLIDCQRVSSDGFVSDRLTDEATPQEKQQFFDFLRSFGVNGNVIKDVTDKTERSWMNNGNSYILATLTETLGERRITFTVYPQTWCHYLERENEDEPEQILITPKLDPFSWKDNPPQLVDVFESFERINFVDGVARVMFHEKNEVLLGMRYGLPASMGSLYNQFNEWQNSDYLVRETANGYIGRVWFFLEDEEAGALDATGNTELSSIDKAAKIRDHINRAGTNGSRVAKGFNVLMYPNGLKEPRHLVIPPNTNHEWYSNIKDYNSSYIYASYGWSPILTGLEKPVSSLGNSQTSQILMEKDVLTIKPTQRRKEGMFGKIFRMMGQWAGTDIANDLNIKYQSPFEELIEMNNELNTDTPPIPAIVVE